MLLRNACLVFSVVAASLILLGSAAAASPGQAPAYAAAKRSGPIPAENSPPVVELADGRTVAADRVMVGYRERVDANKRSEIRQRVARILGGRESRVLEDAGPDIEAHAVPEGLSVDDVMREFRADPEVAFAEPDVLRPLQDVPNDPLLGYQWNLARLQATDGWSVSQGVGTALIAIVDTGIFDDSSRYLAPDGKPGHPDLRLKIMGREDFTTTDPALKDPDDWIGHGTHNAGIAAAKTHNALGVSGVAFWTRLLNAKACQSIGCFDSWMANAIRWSVDRGAKVVSLTGAAPGACPATLQSAVDYAWNRNVVVVAPAGNAANSTPVSPAICTHVVSVASTNADDTRSSFSNFGSWITVAAPGGQDAAGNLILSTGYTGLYEYRQGTSMAAPHVSGLAALVYARFPGSTAAAVVQRITSTADRIPGTGVNWQAGRVNVAKALGAQPGPVFIAAPVVNHVPLPLGWGPPPGLLWNGRAALPTARSRVGLAAIGRTIYTVGGASAQGQALSNVESYDSFTNRWQVRAALPGALAAPGVAAAGNGLLYVVGGTPNGAVALNTLRRFDPNTNTWSLGASMPTQRWGLALVRAGDGKLYAFGGRNPGTALSTVEVYDPATNTWAARAAMPTPRVFPAATLGADGRIYVAGGADSSYRPLASFEVFNPATGAWAVRAAMPQPRSSLGLTSAPSGRIYAAGGETPATTSSVAEYDITSNTWRAAVAMPRPRGGGFGLITLPNGALYAVGGWTSGGAPVSDMDVAALYTAKSP